MKDACKLLTVECHNLESEKFTAPFAYDLLEKIRSQLVLVSGQVINLFHFSWCNLNPS